MPHTSEETRKPRVSWSVTALEDEDVILALATGRGQRAIGIFLALCLASRRLGNCGVFRGPLIITARAACITEDDIRYAVEVITETCEMVGERPWLTLGEDDATLTIRSLIKWNPRADETSKRSGRGGYRVGAGRPKKEIKEDSKEIKEDSNGKSKRRTEKSKKSKKSNVSGYTGQNSELRNQTSVHPVSVSGTSLKGGAFENADPPPPVPPGIDYEMAVFRGACPPAGQILVSKHEDEYRHLIASWIDEGRASKLGAIGRRMARVGVEAARTAAGKNSRFAEERFHRAILGMDFDRPEQAEVGD